MSQGDGMTDGSCRRQLWKQIKWNIRLYENCLYKGGQFPPRLGRFLFNARSIQFPSYIKLLLPLDLYFPLTFASQAASAKHFSNKIRMEISPIYSNRQFSIIHIFECLLSPG